MLPRRPHTSTDGGFAYRCTHGRQEPGRVPPRSSHPGCINGTYKCVANVEESSKNLSQIGPKGRTVTLETRTRQNNWMDMQLTDRSSRQWSQTLQAHPNKLRQPHTSCRIVIKAINPHGDLNPSECGQTRTARQKQIRPLQK